MSSEFKNLKIVFFGGPQYTVSALQKLHSEGWPIVLVVTPPDKPAGRGGILASSPLKLAAQKLGITVRTPINLRDEQFWYEFSEISPDLCIVVAYNKIIPKRYLDIPKLGMLNIHPSLLPEYRGPSPIQSAVLDGRESTGVSIMLLDEMVDHGPILAAEPWAIPTTLDSSEIHDELFRVGANLLSRILPEYVDGNLKPTEQNHQQATFTQKFSRDDGRINWSRPADQIYNRVRALSQEPGVWTTWKGEALKIIRAHPVIEENHDDMGMVSERNEKVVVSTGHGSLALEIIQLAGGRTMSAKEFANGRKDFIGSVLE